MQDIELAVVSQHTPAILQPGSGCTAHPRSAAGHFRPSSAGFAYRPRPLSPKSGHSASATSLVTVGDGQSQLKDPANPYAAENRRVQVTNAADK
jgi:hypothetical protein